MQIYLVGGAVRDKLLNIECYDQDWVVVGSSPEEMHANGFISVGQDFPVFLHPKTKQEHALARTERKSGQGYTGFECFYAPDVTLEEDLARRDLTINAIAQDDQGNLIDPYNGQADIQNKVLRHVSDAFVEDPVRVLRVARFAAKLAHLGFQVAPETQALMRDMTKQGELAHLTAERVWQEWHKSMSTPNPERFLEVLREVGALAVILPEIDALFGIPQTKKWHPEVDTGIHTLLVAAQAKQLAMREKLNSEQTTLLQFAAQTHDLGKALTPKEELPSHKMHGMRGLKPIRELCNRLKVPKAYLELALAVSEHHIEIHNAAILKAKTVLKILNKIDVWRKPERFELVLQAGVADVRGRTGFENHDYSQRELMQEYYQAAKRIDVQAIIAQGFQGKEIREELEKQRIEAIDKIKKENQERTEATK